MLKNFVFAFFGAILSVGVASAASESTAYFQLLGSEKALNKGQTINILPANSNLTAKISGRRPVVDPVAVTVDGGEHTQLDDYVTLRFKLPETVLPAAYDEMVGVYYGDNYTWYYLPEPAAMKAGFIEFKMQHLCNIGVERPEDAELMDTFIHRTAVSGFSREHQQKNLVEKLQDGIAEGLADLGLDDKTIAGNILRFALDEVPGGGYVHSAIDGNFEDLPGGELAVAIAKGDNAKIYEKICEKSSEYLMNYMASALERRQLLAANFNNQRQYKQAAMDTKILTAITSCKEIFGDKADVFGHFVGRDLEGAGKALIKDEDEYIQRMYDEFAKCNFKQASRALAEKIAVKMVPAVSKVQKFAELIKTSANIWADDTVNEVFEKFYSEYADANGRVNNDEWAEITARVPGALRWMKTCGIDEANLRRQFEFRAANNRKILEREKQLEKMVKAWRDGGLLSREKCGFGEKESIMDRLERLYGVRQAMIERFSIDGKLCKGKLNTMNDEDFLSYVMWYWYFYGSKNRGEFEKWVREEVVDLTKFKNIAKNRRNAKKKKAGTHWVLVETKSVLKPGGQKWPCVNDYSGENTEYRWKCVVDKVVAGKVEDALFSSTCTNPPRVIMPNETVSFGLSHHCVGKTYYNLATSAQVRWEYPEVDLLSVKDLYGAFKLKEDRQIEGVTQEYLMLKARSDTPQHLYGIYEKKIPAGRALGERRAIIFSACHSGTYWVYEWR